MTDIGRRAKQIRRDRGESQEAVARRAGIALMTYMRVENGHTQPTVATLIAIADALEVTPNDLLDSLPAA